jgi:hypothetical protein
VSSYRVPAAELIHVVLDAPVDAQGLSDVTAVRDGADCRVELRAHSAGSGIDGHPLVVRVHPDCTVEDDGSQVSLGLGSSSGAGAETGASPGGPGATPQGVSASGGSGSSATTVGSDGCSLSPGRARSARGLGHALVLGLGVLGLTASRRRAIARRRRVSARR